MARRSNQDIERYYFEMFRRDYQLPPGTIIHGDKPDVILEGKRKIGIEITNFFLEDGARPGSEQVQRRAREAVVSEAQRIYLKNGGNGIKILFGFDKARPIQDRGKVAKNIAEMAKHIEGRNTGKIGKDVYQHIAELSFIYLLNEKEYLDPKWAVMQIHSTTVLSMKGLQAIVRSKEVKSQFYKPCEAYWLVVVVDFIDRAQDQAIRVDGSEKVNSAVFERVLVYKTHFGHVFEAKGCSSE